MYSMQIRDALERRHLLRFSYRDRAASSVVEPYIYGESKPGNFVLSAWLISGATHDAGPNRWRLYLDKEMRSVEVLPDHFPSNRPRYKPTDPRFRMIICPVAKPLR
jgi:hypothetical protein